VSINLDLAYEKFPRLHIAEAYKKFVFGDAAIIDKSVELFSTEEDKTVVQQFFIDNSIAGPVVVVHMRQVGIVDGRNIPIDFWGDLLELVLDSTEATVIQIGSNNDLSFDGDPRLVNALGKFSIHQLKELIAQADVFVGADSAPMHVAFCTATPVVGLFTTVRAEYREVFRTPSNFESVASNIECYGCKEHIPAPAVEFTCGRNDVDCVNRFDPKIVLDKIEKFL
jgi:ADP-heptose:LPS heptosyltransferase